MKNIIIIILLLLLPLIMKYPMIFLPLLLLLGGILYFIIRRTSNKIKKEEQKISQSIKEATDIYRKLRSEVDIPIETRIVYYKDGDINLLKGSLQLWLKDGILHLFPFIPRIDKPMDVRNEVYLLKIDVRDIEYFSKDEDKKNGTILKYFHKGQNYKMIFSNRDYKIFRELMQDKDFYFLKKEDKVG